MQSNSDLHSLSWVSAEVEALWLGRIRRILEARHAVEYRSVFEGNRKCGLIEVPPERFDQVSAELAEAGLHISILQRKRVQNGYQAVFMKAQEGEPFVFWCVIGAPDSTINFKMAYEAHESIMQGYLLGYPHCCREFFHSFWDREGLIDPTWYQATYGKMRPMRGSRARVRGPWECNSVIRWLVGSPAIHLPCGFHCKASVRVARNLHALAQKLGFGQEIQWLREILGLPFSWSSSKGIATVKTPLFTFEGRTDLATDGLGVEWTSVEQPSASLEDDPRPELNSWYFEDNGFVNLKAMRDFHGPCVLHARRLLPAQGGSLLDLGCGNGALAAQLARSCSLRRVTGIDQNPEAITRARTFVLPEFRDTLHCENIMKTPRVAEPEPYDLVLIDLDHVQCLQEATGFLKSCGKRFLGYHYRSSMQPYFQRVRKYGLELAPFWFHSPNVREVRLRDTP